MRISFFLNKNNNNLDLLRIILALLVIVGHSHALNGSDRYWIDPIEYLFKITNSGALAVKIFLFISGLVVANSYLARKDVLYFIISRFFRLIPALLFLLLITTFVFGPIITKFTLNEYFSQLNNFEYIRCNVLFYSKYLLPGVFIENLYPNIVNGSLWSLRYEVGCYSVLLICFIIFRKLHKYFLAIPILLIIIDSLLPNRIIFSFLDNNPEKYLLPLSFTYGVVLALFSDKIVINFKVVLLSIILFQILKMTRFEYIALILASCNFIVYLSSLKFVLKFKPKYDISYGIYLWGFLIQQTIFSITGHINTAIHCLLAITVSIILAIFTYLLIEKPFIKFGKSTFNWCNNVFTTQSKK